MGMHTPYPTDIVIFLVHRRIVWVDLRAFFEDERVRTGPRSPHLTWSSESRETPAMKKRWLDFRRHDSGVRRHQAARPGGFSIRAC